MSLQTTDTETAGNIDYREYILCVKNKQSACF